MRLRAIAALHVVRCLVQLAAEPAGGLTAGDRRRANAKRRHKPATNYFWSIWSLLAIRNGAGSSIAALRFMSHARSVFEST